MTAWNIDFLSWNLSFSQMCYCSSHTNKLFEYLFQL